MKKKTPPPAVTTLLTDDQPDHVIEAAAVTERRDAFRAAYHWHDLPLKWTSSRASLFDFLRIPAPVLSEETLSAIRAARAAEGTPEESALQARADALFSAETGGSTGHFRNATLILWLAAHEPKDWQPFVHDRPRFLTAIDEWVDEHVATGEIQDLAEVTNKLLADADATKAIMRPQHRNPDEEGN